jgi:signal transduction histidine kinase
MRERAMSIGATLEIKGLQGKGTTVTLSLPKQANQGSKDEAKR